MKIACISCSQMSVIRSNPNYETSSDKDESRSASEPDSASLHQRERSTFRRWRNLQPMMKQQACAIVGLLEVKEDGAYRKIGQEPGRPCKERERAQHVTGKQNCERGLARESDKPIVAKSGNEDRAKGLYNRRAAVERRGEPLV
jgi:hypothetical protein